MLGAIVGDIAGSVYEWNNIKAKDFPLFRDDCFFTDDTVMAIATAAAIILGRFYAGGHAFDYSEPWSLEELKAKLKKFIESHFGYDLSQRLDEIRPTYRFNESCQETVPQAIVAFLESVDFEDAIRNAISLGGDSDTLAAITGSIAEAAYGVPDWIKNKALSYLDAPLRDVYDRWMNASKISSGLL